MSGLLKYLCTGNYFDGVQFYAKGHIYLFAANPNSDFFELYDTDDQTPANYGTIDRDGTWRGPVNNFDDLKFPANTGKLGVLDKPDYDYTDLGYLMPQNDATEKLYFSKIVTHRALISPQAVWYPHVHFFQDEAETPTFKVDFRLTDAAGTVGTFTTLTTVSEPEFVYSAGTIHQILRFPPFRPSDHGGEGLAFIIDIIFYREDNTVAGDVLFKEFDIHIPFDAPLGSGQELIK